LDAGVVYERIKPRPLGADSSDDPFSGGWICKVIANDENASRMRLRHRGQARTIASNRGDPPTGR
jgi:hypothetical protein